MVVTFAECCSPIPGDPIIGLLGSGEGIVVHAEQCPRLDKIRAKPNSLLNLRWSPDVQQTFPLYIRVEAIDASRLLANMAAAIADAFAEISDIRVQNRGGQHYQFIFKLSVRDRVHLARVMRHLRRIPEVYRISRGLEHARNNFDN